MVGSLQPIIVVAMMLLVCLDDSNKARCEPGPKPQIPLKNDHERSALRFA
jgi:hypothetical protein